MSPMSLYTTKKTPHIFCEEFLCSKGTTFSKGSTLKHSSTLANLKFLSLWMNKWQRREKGIGKVKIFLIN